MPWNARFEKNQERIDRVRIRAEKRLIAVGFMISRTAKQYCPIDSGRLRASISVNWTKSGMVRGRTDVHTLTKNPYGQQIEQVNTAHDGVGQPGGAHFFTVLVGTNVRYAPFVEFGTSKMGNTPFLRFAYESNAQLLQKIGRVSEE